LMARWLPRPPSSGLATVPTANKLGVRL